MKNNTNTQANTNTKYYNIPYTLLFCLTNTAMATSKERHKSATWSALLTSSLCPYCPHNNKAEKGFRFCSHECAKRYQDSCFQCKSHPNGRVISKRFCSNECSDAWYRHEAVPVSLRPFCKMNVEECPDGIKCYNRHGISRSSMPYHLVLMVSRSHVSRIVEYVQHEIVLRNETKLRVVKTDLTPVSTAATKNKKRPNSARIYVAIDPITSTLTSSSSSSSSGNSNGVTNGTKKLKIAHASVTTDMTELIQHAVEVLLADINLFRNLIRVYPVEGAASSETELLQIMSKTLHIRNSSSNPTPDQTVYFRPRCFPRTLEAVLAKELVNESKNIALTSQGYHRVLCSMSIDDGILYGSYLSTNTIREAAAAKLIEQNGNSVQGSNCKNSSSNTSSTIKSGETHHRVSRAAWKLCEVYRRRPQFNPSLNGKKFVAVDIGASPGGWSYELASMAGCEKVYAVDPGELSTPIPPNVVHLQKKIEDCTEQLKNQSVKFDCVVCDMNSSPRMTVESFLGLSDVLNNGAVIVLTFKNFVGGRKAFVKALDEALLLLEGKIVERDIIRLMSGGVEERTLVGKWV